jgi:hypothetical protein
MLRGAQCRAGTETPLMLLTQHAPTETPRIGPADGHGFLVYRLAAEGTGVNLFTIIVRHRSLFVDYLKKWIMSHLFTSANCTVSIIISP